MRINKPLLIIGIVLALVAVAGLLFVGRLLNPPPTTVPVAMTDLPAGTALDYGQFRLEEWHGLRPETLTALYLSETFPAGSRTLVDIPAGSPLYKAYVDAEAAPDFVTRLTHLVQDSDRLVMALPVKPEMGGNIPEPGDEIDLVFSVGTLRTDVIQSHPTPTPPLTTGRPVTRTTASAVATETLHLPLTSLVLQNVPVLQVAREQVTTSTGGYSADGSATQPQVVEGDAEQLYIAVTREQAEVLGFLLHNGDVLLAVHPGGRAPADTGGLTWDDFEIWFYAQRPDWEE